jgi:serine/threonine protein phosphatase PrpC
MNITTATAKGQRPYQEDTFIAQFMEQGTLLGVFDGHGGDEASQFMFENFAGLFEEALQFPHSLYENLYIDSLRWAFEQSAAHLKNYDAGTTASVVFIPNDSRKVYTAVIGDSPIIAKIEDGRGVPSIWVGPEHNVRTNEAERVAATDRGGFYSGGYICKSKFGPGLQMGRALGDASLFPILSTEPEIAQVTVAPMGFILIGSDGLVDPAHYDFKKEAEQVIARVSQDDDAQALVDRAVLLETGDNATAILVKF